MQLWVFLTFSFLTIASVNAVAPSFNISMAMYDIVSITDRTIHICSGSILNWRTILTTAQCVENPSPLRVSAGSKNCNLVDEYDPAGFDIMARFIHPDYNPLTLEADIAVVHVDRSLQEAKKVLKVNLPNETSVGKVEDMFVWGWNWDFHLDHDTQTFYGAVTKLLPQDECVHYYGAKFLTDKMLCVEPWWFTNTSQTEPLGCDLDPAMPMAYSGKLAGLGLYGGGCLLYGWPAVFLDTFPYVEWIWSKMNHVHDIPIPQPETTPEPTTTTTETEPTEELNDKRANVEFTS